jgi:beta-fructofuranosidase
MGAPAESATVPSAIEQPAASSDAVDDSRPRIHFTARSGWINDPHGICWAGGEYHLFYQHNPDSQVWASPIVWGHAVSPDLVQWREQPIALTPHRDEEGCWSGAALVEDGSPTLFYTSVPSDNWHRGRVALARPDPELRHWSSGPEDIMIDGPPDELGAHAFRDPCLVPTESGLSMVVGAGVSTGEGLAAHFSSTDQRAWKYDGVLCSRSSNETDGIWTGGMWECPQLFQVGDDWVLAVSVWDDDKLFYVAAAVGSYDGRRFTPEGWFRLSHDPHAYAMTSFKDRDGRACVMFWLREQPDHDPTARPWAGALSLPLVAEISADRTLRLRPHPDLDALRGERLWEGAFEGLSELADAGRGLNLEAQINETDHLNVTLQVGSAQPLTLMARGGSLLVCPEGEPGTWVSLTEGRLRVVVDTGIVEVFGDTGVSALRVPERSDITLVLSGSASELTVHRLERTSS